MIFEYETKIYGYECDIYGHLNNAYYQNIYEAARANMLGDIGLSLHYLFELGIHIYVKRITIDYLRGIRFGTNITVKSRIESLSRVRSLWHQEIYTAEGGLMNMAKVEGVFAKSNKPYRIPFEMEVKLRDIM